MFVFIVSLVSTYIILWFL